MKKNVFVNILNFLIPIFICLLLFTLAKIPYYPKPKQNSKLPSYIKWNCHTGEYYNSKNFKWDNKLKTYTQINRSIDNSARGIFGDDKQFKDWKKKHKYSKNLLDMRIIRATEKVASGTERLSYFNPHMDNRLKCIAQLGLEELPTMLKRIKNDSEIATVLRTTIFVMTKARPEYCDQSDEGRDLYVLNYITRIKNSKHIIINAYNRLKLEINPETRTNIKKEITNVGIWALMNLKKIIMNY